MPPSFRFVLSLLFSTLAFAQAPQTAKTPIVIVAGRLIDVRAGRVLSHQKILVEGERITQVGPDVTVPAGAQTIDLSNATVLPGMIDAHTHVLLNGDFTDQDYADQLLKDSIPYRAIRATVAVRTALMNGFTTIRDLETEGAMYADVDLKKAIERGVIPGPRMFVATRAFAPTGMYPLDGYSWELKMPDGVQIVDGPANIRRAVREQVKFGADWIKYYSDRGYNVKDGVLHSLVNFTDDELKALVGESHRLGKKVAAHAMGREGIESALRAGVDSLEHGNGLDDELIDIMVKRGVNLCPTIYLMEGRSGLWKELARQEERAFRLALRKGVKITYGTDVGGYAWTDNQAKEFPFMVKYGMTPMQAIQSATTVAAALLDQQERLGAIEPGKLADIVAVPGDPLANIEELQKVRFVMKGGVIYKQ